MPGKGGAVVRLSTQLTIVIVSTTIGILGLIFGLAVWADWSEGAIVAMITAFGALLANTIAIVRNQAKTAEILANQDDKLDRVVEQTNGMSHAERTDIARRAAQEAVALSKRGDPTR